APEPRSFDEMVALFAERREGILHAHLVRDVHPVRFEPGRLEFRPGPQAPRDLASRIGQCLGEWTGRRWVIAVSAEPGQASIAERQAAQRRREHEAVSRHPLVQAVLQHFPGATVEAIRELAVPAGAAAADPEAPGAATDDAGENDMGADEATDGNGDESP